MKLCRLTGATLIVAKLDRLSRNAAFLVNLMESQVRFVCADNPQANELTIHILAAVAQQERKAISERTKVALRAAKARGTVLGNPRPHEFRPKDTRPATAQRRKLAAEYASDLAEVIADIQARSITSLSCIAEELNRRGITTRRGGRWHASTVRLAKLRIDSAMTTLRLERGEARQ